MAWVGPPPSGAVRGAQAASSAAEYEALSNLVQQAWAQAPHALVLPALGVTTSAAVGSPMRRTLAAWHQGSALGAAHVHQRMWRRLCMSDQV